MKKIVLFLIGVLYLSNIPIANAKEITFDDVAQKYQEKYPWSKVEAMESEYLQEIEDNVSVLVSKDKIEIYIENEDKQKISTLFTHKNGIISYQPNFSSNEFEFQKQMLDSYAIVKMIYVVAELKGYTVQQLIDVADVMEDGNFTMEKHGMEETIFGDTPSDDSAKKSFQIDINRFNLEGRGIDFKKENKFWDKNAVVIVGIIFGMILTLIIATFIIKKRCNKPII